MHEMEAAGVPGAARPRGGVGGVGGWRVNYDAVLLDLARLVEAPVGPVGVGSQPDRAPVPSASGDPPRRRKTRRVRAIATTMASRPRAMP